MAKVSRKPAKDTSSKTNAAAKKNAIKWGVRGGIGALLLLIMFLAVRDFNTKSTASATTTSWLKALQVAEDNKEELRCSELSQYVIGQPEMSGGFGEGRVVYTWKGPFRSYSTTITCDGEDEPVVMRIDGPGS